MAVRYMYTYILFFLSVRALHSNENKMSWNNEKKTNNNNQRIKRIPCTKHIAAIKEPVEWTTDRVHDSIANQRHELQTVLSDGI